MKLFISFVLISILAACSSPTSTPQTYPEPSVITDSLSNVTSTGATLSGNVTAQGGAEVMSRGACYATTQYPTITNTCLAAGSGLGSFSVVLKGLSSGVLYYARAFATNTVGTSYGRQVVFTTITPIVGTWSRDNTTAVVEVINPVTGRVWMDRNLGANRAATSSTDAQAYGDYYQWGRAADGHQKQNSATSTTLSISDTPGHGSFILTKFFTFDWRSPKNDNLWQGVNGINNPCPVGYRLPTEAEWNSERASWSSNNGAGAFSSPLKLTLAGERYYYEGRFYLVKYYGGYWASSVSNMSGSYLILASNNAEMDHNYRAQGYSVRCIKD